MLINIQAYWGDGQIYYPHIFTSKIIAGMLADNKVSLITLEHRCPISNGGIAFLEDLIKEWNWDASNFTLITPNTTVVTNCQIKFKFLTASRTVHDMPVKPKIKWTGKFDYGMFFGRFTSHRMHAIIKHKEFKYKHRGLTSMQQGPNEALFHKCNIEMMNFLRESPDTSINDIVKFNRYSDFDKLKDSIINNSHNDPVWDRVYPNIAIEIIAETSTQPGCYSIGEKLLRCVMYRRPFLLIGPAGMLKYLNDYWGLRTFNNWIPADYDQFSGATRVNRIFEILTTLIESGDINDIIKTCDDDIEHNYQTLLAFQASLTQDQKNINKNLTKFYKED